MRHFIIVGVLIIAATLGIYYGLTSFHLMPVEASAQAITIDWMWNLQLIAMSFLFALIFVPMMYSLVVFRRRKGDTSEGEHFEGNNTLEITWTVVPLFVVVLFAVLGAGNLSDTLRADPNAMVVQVTGFQWGWNFVYPDYGISTKELYLPKDKQILFRLKSTDVIHSFWVPEFRPKQDLVPGRVTELRITPTKEGNYKVRCAELCGTSHSYMESPVIVVGQDKFDAWVKEQQKLSAAQQATPEGRGQKIYETYCIACHSVDGSKSIAPTWFGLYNSQVELADGTAVTADDTYIINSIKNPAQQVVNGFSPMSFDYKAVSLTDSDLNDILAYIKTIK